MVSKLVGVWGVKTRRNPAPHTAEDTLILIRHPTSPVLNLALHDIQILGDRRDADIMLCGQQFSDYAKRCGRAVSTGAGFIAVGGRLLGMPPL